MKIAIVGTGKMSAALARGWLKAGHSVSFGSRDPASKRSFVDEVGPGATMLAHAEAVGSAEVVVLALPYREVEGFAGQHAKGLTGKVVIDITNPFDSTPPGGLAGAEVTARAIGAGAKVVAAFKTNYAATLSAPVDASGAVRDAFYCGDAADAKLTVRGLIEVLGLRPVDCGPLRAARVLDGMVPLLIEMDRRLGSQGVSRRPHWKFVTP
jgi:NADPH-dependent F420 reductase